MFQYRRSVVILVVTALLLSSLPSRATAGVISTETLHRILGYGTVALAGATFVTNSDKDLHESLAYATAAGAFSTVLTGVVEHRDRLDFDHGQLARRGIGTS